MKLELLAPAGSLESVKAAINAGADAVYAGGEKFGARAYAENLNTEKMIEAIDFAHIHGRKIYLTINTLFKDYEIDKLYDYILPFYMAGLDAVIVQDLGVIKYINDYFPGLHIHASTQMTVMGIETVKMLQKMGADRVVVPRELSLDEIKKISDNSDIEIESFVHGALCYCYSGQCLLSSFIGGRSGNRGRCAQPCRMPYSAIKDGKYLNSKNEQYLLSPKDMCTLEILPEIISAGVMSLKIEGRMKKPEYTAGTVSVYRKYIDRYLENGKDGYKVEQSDINILMDLFNRNGFNEGYYKIHNDRKMISLTEPAFRTQNKQLIDNIQRDYIKKDVKENINLNLTFSKQLPATIVAYCGDTIVEVEGSVPSDAKNIPLTIDTVEKQMRKMGTSPFNVEKIDAHIDDNIFMTMGELNGLRRDAVEKLYDTILIKHRRKEPDVIRKEITQSKKTSSQKPILNCHIMRMEQLAPVIGNKYVDTIYIEWSALNNKNIMKTAEDIHQAGKQFFIALPHVSRKEAIEFFDNNLWMFAETVDGYLVRNQEEYFYVNNKCSKQIVFDYSVYSFNKMAKNVLNTFECKRTTVPVELNCGELSKRGCGGEEMVVYGYIPVMISAGCVKKTTCGCNRTSEDISIKDRTGTEFLCRSECQLCYNVIYNSKPVSLLTKSSDVSKLGLKAIRLSFTQESKKEISDIISKFGKQYIDNIMQEELSNFTRGHFTRGVK